MQAINLVFLIGNASGYCSCFGQELALLRWITRPLLLTRWKRNGEVVASALIFVFSQKTAICGHLLFGIIRLWLYFDFIFLKEFGYICWKVFFVLISVVYPLSFSLLYNYGKETLFLFRRWLIEEACFLFLFSFLMSFISHIFINFVPK